MKKIETELATLLREHRAVMTASEGYLATVGKQLEKTGWNYNSEAQALFKVLEALELAGFITIKKEIK